MKNLKDSWRKICNDYVKEFCKRHEYEGVQDIDWYWIGDDPGTLIDINDMFISMENIRYDVDNNVPVEYFEKWYWKNLELYELGIKHWMNYSSYCKGAPDKYSEECIKKLKELKQNVNLAREKVEEAINESPGWTIEKLEKVQILQDELKSKSDAFHNELFLASED